MGNDVFFAFLSLYIAFFSDCFRKKKTQAKFLIISNKDHKNEKILYAAATYICRIETKKLFLQKLFSKNFQRIYHFKNNLNKISMLHFYIAFFSGCFCKKKAQAV